MFLFLGYKVLRFFDSAKLPYNLRTSIDDAKFEKNMINCKRLFEKCDEWLKNVTNGWKNVTKRKKM